MKIIENRILVQTKFLQFNDTSYLDRNSNKHTWSWVERPNISNIVLIVPLLKDKLVIIKEFRIPINSTEFSFPAGLIDNNETIEEGIKRELHEEVGLEVTRILHITNPLFNSTGITNECISVAFVEVSGNLSNKNNESSEEIEIFAVDKNEIVNLLNDTNNKFSAKSYLIMKYFSKTGNIDLF